METIYVCIDWACELFGMSCVFVLSYISHLCLYQIFFLFFHVYGLEMGDISMLLLLANGCENPWTGCGVCLGVCLADIDRFHLKTMFFVVNRPSILLHLFHVDSFGYF